MTAFAFLKMLLKSTFLPTSNRTHWQAYCWVRLVTRNNPFNPQWSEPAGKTLQDTCWNVLSHRSVLILFLCLSHTILCLMQNNLAVILTTASWSLAEKLLTLGLRYCESHPLCLFIPYFSKRISSSKVLQALTHWYIINLCIAERTREGLKALALSDKHSNIFPRCKELS